MPVKLVLANARYDLGAGETKRITVRLPKGIRKLAKNRRIAVLADTTTRDAAGHLAQGSERFTLKLPRR